MQTSKSKLRFKYFVLVLTIRSMVDADDL